MNQALGIGYWVLGLAFGIVLNIGALNGDISFYNSHISHPSHNS